MLLFVINAVTGIQLGEMIREIWPFIVVLISALFVLILVPDIVLWLPREFGYAHWSHGFRNEKEYTVGKKSIIVNVSEQPIKIQDQQLGFFQSVVVTNTTLCEVESGVLIERFSDYTDEKAFLDIVSPFGIWGNPNVANVGGLQIQGVKGEVVVLYFEPLTTQNLKFSGVPEG